jgi:hypothetical protein
VRAVSAGLRTESSDTRHGSFPGSRSRHCILFPGRAEGVRRVTFPEQVLWLVGGWIAGSITTGVVLGVLLRKVETQVEDPKKAAIRDETPKRDNHVLEHSGMPDLTRVPRSDEQALHALQALRAEINDLLDTLTDIRRRRYSVDRPSQHPLESTDEVSLDKGN